MIIVDCCLWPPTVAETQAAAPAHSCEAERRATGAQPAFRERPVRSRHVAVTCAESICYGGVCLHVSWEPSPHPLDIEGRETALGFLDLIINPDSYYDSQTKKEFN